MARQAVAPVHVRLAPQALEALRALAAQRGTTVHAEVVQAVADRLAAVGEEPEIRALKTITAALAERFAWMAPPTGEDHAGALLRLYRAALVALLDEIAGEDTSPDTQQLGKAAARRLLADLKLGDWDLAVAVRVLGIRQEGSR